MKVEKNHLRSRSGILGSVKGAFGGALLVSSMFLLGACENKFDEYYEKPSWIENPAYDVLQKEGRFSKYLQLVDKTLYAKQLKGSGSYTFFAPNDEAFDAWLAEKGYSSVADVPADVASDIVSYTMVYNQYEALHLGDIWQGATWEGNKGLSFRKQTPSYKTLYKELRPGDTDSIYVYEGLTTPFNKDMFDHRYLHIYTPAYFAAKALDAVDYETVYPGATWNNAVGNVHGASIVTGDIYASNGVVHELDAVVEAPQTIDEMIVEYGAADNNERPAQGWGVLKELLYNKFADGSYQFLSYEEDKDAALYFQRMYPEKESELATVYSRNYNLVSLISAFNFNEHVSTGDATERTESEAYTLFLPSKSAFDDYINNTVLKYTKNKDFNELSEDVIQTVYRAHVARQMVWPSKFASAKNVARDVNGEFINGAGAAGAKYAGFGVTDVEVASNGIVYHIDHVIESGLFKSVYGRILLDPAYSYTRMLLGGSALYTNLTSNTPFVGGTNDPAYNGVDTRYQYAVLLSSDALLEADGFTYDNLNSTFNNSALLGTIDANSRINRLVNNGVFIRELGKDDFSYPTPLNFNEQPAALAGEYDGFGYAVNYYGELVRYKNGQLQAAGNIKDSTYVTVTADETSYVNGTVYTIDRLLNYSQRETDGNNAAGWEQSASILDDVTAYLAAHPECSLFKKYYDATKDAHVINYISTSDFHTVLIPTDERMQELINAGMLPTVDEVTANANGEMITAGDFVLGHFLQGAVFADDGLDRVYMSDAHYKSITNSTAIRITEGSLDLIAARTYVKVEKMGTDNRLVFGARDIEAGVISVVSGINSQEGTNAVIRGIDKSNVMARQGVIHQFDGYLYYKINKVEEPETPAEGEESEN